MDIGRVVLPHSAGVIPYSASRSWTTVYTQRRCTAYPSNPRQTSAIKGGRNGVYHIAPPFGARSLLHDMSDSEAFLGDFPAVKLIRLSS